MTQAAHQLIHSSASNEWYTPAKYIEAVREVLGTIDLDPASCEAANETVRATFYWKKSADGLLVPWYGSVFLNPPYGKTGGESNAGIWTRKLKQEFDCGNVTAAILLINATPDRPWFQALLLDGHPVCFTDHRIRFIDEHGVQQRNPTHGNAFIYLGPGPQARKFAEVFSQFGTVARQSVWDVYARSQVQQS